MPTIIKTRTIYDPTTDPPSYRVEVHYAGGTVVRRAATAQEVAVYQGVCRGDAVWGAQDGSDANDFASRLHTEKDEHEKSTNRQLAPTRSRKINLLKPENL